MASSAFSFHCMICFEEFDPITNYPVVLPCGHTYVCISCANRLDKCMECRTPLFININTLPPPPPNSNSLDFPHQKENRHDQHAGRSYSPSVRSSPAGLRSSGVRNSSYVITNAYNSNTNKPPPQPIPVKKERLPLPKNAVLLSLIQASEPARRRTEDQSPRTPLPPSPDKIEPKSLTHNNLPKFTKPSPLFLDSSSSGEHDENEDDEEQKIRVGTYLSGGPCGTYAVAVKTGLLVYPSLFEHTLQPNEDVVTRDVEALVKNSYKNRHPIIPEASEIASLERSHTWVECHEDEHAQEGGDCGVEALVAPPPTKAADTEKLLSASERKFKTRCNSIGGIFPPTNTKNLQRQFSHGSHPFQEEFDRPLLRLKYGDRVQVVSMDSRGWVKLARGYGYIRLENDKQLVKVGGTSDKACQIEAILHELSIERDRLKYEQKKLERLSAGLMIDLQSSLLMDEDHVVVPAPEGMLRSESELSLSMPNKMDRQANTISVDDLDISTRSKSILISPHVNNNVVGDNEQPREIRTAKSHSPGRNSFMMNLTSTPIKAPPSPNSNYSSTNSTSTPTRVNFRTGLSGHRALSSSLVHPHDFIDHRGPSRSMSNHAGLSSQKPSTRGRSNY